MRGVGFFDAFRRELNDDYSRGASENLCTGQTRIKVTLMK